jgi:hypothetical protein
MSGHVGGGAKRDPRKLDYNGTTWELAYWGSFWRLQPERYHDGGFNIPLGMDKAADAMLVTFISIYEQGVSEGRNLGAMGARLDMRRALGI